jgi:hypothetical protein
MSKRSRFSKAIHAASRGKSRASTTRSKVTTGSSRAASGRQDVKSLEELVTKYGYAPADELAGSQNSRAFLDYGAPVVVADSSPRSDRTRDEDAVWGQKLGS